MTSIGTNILTGCTSLITLTAPFNSLYNTSNNSYLRYYFGGTSYSAGGTIPSSLINVIVEEGTTALGNYAFYDCSSLTSIVIPDSVTSIGEWAFYNCSSLTSIVISEGVTSIGDRVFIYCIRLTIYDFSRNQVISIGETLRVSYCA